MIDQIAETGPIGFAEFVEAALYDEHAGFYATQGRAGGRRGDFITSVEVGPLFGAVIADWLDERWHEAGQPSRFRVSEVGAGVGTLVRAINRAEPSCRDALHYTVVERSAGLRAKHEADWRSAEHLPDDRQHVILANELLDNLAFDIAERVDDGWAPVQVAVVDGELAMQVSLANSDLSFLSELAAGSPVGARVPVARHAIGWIEDARQRADHVLVFDYAATTDVLAERGQAGWLRTYVDHVRGSDPLDRIGFCDITHDVPVDQLPPPQLHRTQAEWLRDHGIENRVEQARQTWVERAHIGDLAAIVARSAISEAEALTDPTGLGAFAVLHWC